MLRPPTFSLKLSWRPNGFDEAERILMISGQKRPVQKTGLSYKDEMKNQPMAFFKFVSIASRNWLVVSQD